MTHNAIFETDLPFPMTRGKVRDVYDLEAVLPGHVLLVATDRVSAFDVVMPTPIPGKGTLLTEIALFWFRHFDDVRNHLSDQAWPAELEPFSDVLDGRSMLVRRVDVVPFECVVRGYLAGSGWKDYQATGRIGGIELPTGLVDGDRLPEPIFTPATKATTGHDENVTFDQMADAIGGELASTLRDRTLDLYRRASDHAGDRGILLADTKLEFGLNTDGQIVLADEIFTPDSSRYWPADTWQPGGPQQSFDKQFVRDHLASLDWDKTPPGPALPDDVIAGTVARYQHARDVLTRP
ncbi:MAG: phosphoribosylaminoimidazolesuccinocarboxamide synthase [Planctomycetota bacterium]